MPLTFNSVDNNPFLKDGDLLTNLFPPEHKFLHRDEQLDQITLNLAPILKNQRATNFFVYGQRGAGKTAIIRYKAEELAKECSKKKIGFIFTYTNCGQITSNNEINVIGHIIEQLSPSTILSKSGLNTGFIYKKLEEAILKLSQKNILIILDEIDAMLKGPSTDNLLYFLSRAKDSPIFRGININTIIISNQSMVKDILMLRTESSFGRERIDFLNYDAKELLDILKSRAETCFNPGIIGEGVLEMISGDESKKYGDARRALEILRKCYTLALAQNKKKITLDLAETAIITYDQDIYLERIEKLTNHQKILFLVLLFLDKDSDNYTQKIFENYITLCSKINVTPLDLRSIQNFIETFEEANLIEGSVYYEKRIKRTAKHIKLIIRNETKQKAYKFLTENFGIYDNRLVNVQQKLKS